MPAILGLDIGSNSVGSAWIDTNNKTIVTGTSVFPAGVEERDESRGDPKNIKRRMARRTRITLARRAERKRKLRSTLIEAGLLPPTEEAFKKLLEQTNPWDLRRKGLTQELTPYEFGRVLLHLSQRRGALGVEADPESRGKVKAAMVRLHRHMLDHYSNEDMKAAAAKYQAQIDALNRKKNRSDEESDELEIAQAGLLGLVQALLANPTITFGRYMADRRDRRDDPDRMVTTITATPDRRKVKKGGREFREPMRNKAGNYHYSADRGMIRDEFAKLWNAQVRLWASKPNALTDALRKELDNETRTSKLQHQGHLFGQRKASWDAGMLGRCVLEPTDRCAPHADMYVSRFRVLEYVNNLRVVESGKDKRPLSVQEREAILGFLSGPLGQHEKGAHKGKLKRKATLEDLRRILGWPHGKSSQIRFKQEERDDEREANTDWFNREIVHGVIGEHTWRQLPESVQSAINQRLLKFDPAQEGDEQRLKAIVTRPWKDNDSRELWSGLDETKANTLIAAWTRRPKVDANRLNMSRRAVCNLLPYMEFAFTRRDGGRDDHALCWLDKDSFDPAIHQWLTQIEARRAHAESIRHQIATAIVEEEGVSIDQALERAKNDSLVRRYMSGAKGATARDRYYVKQEKHWLKDKEGKIILDVVNGKPIPEPPPAPMISNPVARKAVHEVRRHLIDYLKRFRRTPDEVNVELWREAAMGKVDADRELFVNRLANRIRKEIIQEFSLEDKPASFQRAAVDRVVLCVQQGYLCPLCGQPGLCPRKAAYGEDCELAHIFPRGSGGPNGFTNIVLAHEVCNQNMRKRTPKDFWEEYLPGGVEAGLAIIEKIYRRIERIKPSEVKTIHRDELWKCYLAKPPKRYFAAPPQGGNFFTNLGDLAKIEQFNKEKPDPDFSSRHEAATKYAASQVMAYLADALFDGAGLPERGGERRIDATRGQWTKRLRDEWELYWDKPGSTPDSRKKSSRAELVKDRDVHYHHAIDAVVTAYCTRTLRAAWERREREAEAAGVNTADSAEMARYRRDNPLDVPLPFQTRAEFREAVRKAVFTLGDAEKAVSHRAVKRKLIGELHEAFPRGPVLDSNRRLTDRFTKRIEITALTPNHLRVHEEWDTLSEKLDDPTVAETEKRSIRRRMAKLPDPAPGKPGIVRDRALRDRLRKILRTAGLDLGRYDKKSNLVKGGFGPAQIKKLAASAAIRQASGVPIRAVVLLWTILDPVVTSKWDPSYVGGPRIRTYDAVTDKGDRRAARVYIGGNNHHVEIREDSKGNLHADIVSTFDAARRLLERLRELRNLERPFRHLRGPLSLEVRQTLPPKERKALAQQRRKEWKERMRELRPNRCAIIVEHPIVDRRDNERGTFVMSLSEGEMLKMNQKPNKKGEPSGPVGFFVVAEIEKAKRRVVLVPHWDARRAGERKDSDGKAVPGSKREEFTATASELKSLAPPGQEFAVKVRVSPLGDVTELNRD